MGIGIKQALILVGAAFAGGLGLSLVAYAGIERATHIPIAMTLSRVAVVLGLTAGLGGCSSRHR